MKFVLYEDKRHEWRWRLVAANGRIIADSAEGYTRKEDAHRALADILTAFQQGPEVYKVETME